MKTTIELTYEELAIITDVLGDFIYPSRWWPMKPFKGARLDIAKDLHKKLHLVLSERFD